MDADLPNPWAAAAPDVARALDVDPALGLEAREVERRRARFGPNTLRGVRKKSVWRVLFDQVRSLVMLLLFAAATVAFAFGERLEGAAIGVVIVLNALIGFVAELRAVRSMEALRRMGDVTARVRRGGREEVVPAASLVPGDVVVLEGGDLVTADLRLVESSRLQSDESALTGESLPVSKSVEAVPAAASIDARRGMLFKGTAVTRGAGVGLVVGTGMATELGRIARLVEEAEPEVTPLERRLEGLGRRLIVVCLGVAAVTTVAGVLAGEELLLMVETGIALAVAAIPEGLPIVATTALARGMWRLSRRNVLVNRLSAVETLGSTAVVCTDKTGTLTENRMTVSVVAFADGEVAVGVGAETSASRAADGDPRVRAALEIGVLCNDATLEGGTAGDPLEVALLSCARDAGIERATLLREAPEQREVAFDADVRMMATYHSGPGGLRVAVKGAAEAVLEASVRALEASGEAPLDAERRERWLERADALARRGMRVIAVAERSAADADEAPYQDLTVVALLGLLDPPRAEVAETLLAFRRAGIRLVMVTGDQAATAAHVAESVGLADAHAPVVIGSELDARLAAPGGDEELLAVPIFARVSPEQKLRLIELYQARGLVVAMTGDGVNDAPALEKADIGIAMGQRGTQVAREAADMVLRDDSLVSLVEAVRHGRIVFGNIRTFVVYLLSCNASEIAVVAVAVSVGWPLPVNPLQILFLNLVTDVWPALALALGRGEPDVLERQPRPPREPILTARHWRGITTFAVLIAGCVLAAMLVALHGLGYSEERAVTVSFLTLTVAQLGHVFNMRRRGSRFLSNEITRNPWIWGALLVCIAALLAAVYVPLIAMTLRIVAPGPEGWLLVVVAGLAPWVVGQLARSRRATGRSRAAGPGRPR